jgi:hypothetical protein
VIVPRRGPSRSAIQWNLLDGGECLADEAQAPPPLGAVARAAFGARPALGSQPFQGPALAHELLLEVIVLQDGGRIIVTVLAAELTTRAIDRQGPTIHHDTY